jgi:GTP-binding protein HflX
VDASDQGRERQHAVTEEVLEEIGAEEVPRLLVFNKIDNVGDEKAQAERELTLRAMHPGCVVMSARRPEDVAKLREKILAHFQERLVEADLFLPWSAQKERGTIFDTCQVLSERTEGDGTFLRVRGEPEDVQRLKEKFGGAAK